MDINKILMELDAYAEFLNADSKRTEHVKDGNTLDLESIAMQTATHISELRKSFKELPDDVAETAVRFTGGVFLSYLDKEFVATQADGTIYSPDRLIDSVRTLTLNFSSVEQVKEFYEALEAGLKNSKRFMYKLVVDDLPRILPYVEERSNYKKFFGDFSVEVVKNAAYLTESGDRDKGKAFREHYEDLVRRYFADIDFKAENNAYGAIKALDYDILEMYASKGIVPGVRMFEDDYGQLIGARWHSQPDRRERHISFTFDPGNGHNSVYKSVAHFEGVSVSKQVKEFLLVAIDIAAKNLRSRGMTGTELTDTVACLRYAKNHL